MTIALCILAVGVVVGLGSFTVRRWRAALASVARQYGLQVSTGGLLRASSARGVIDGVPVTVDTFTRGGGDSRTTYSRVCMTPVMPGGLTIKKEGAFFGQLFKGEDLEIGDPLFDKRVVVRGPSRAVRALLDRPTRAAVLSAIALNVTVEDGAVTWIKTGYANANTLSIAIDAVLEVAQLLGRPADLSALTEVVRTDDPPVALAALRDVPPGPARDALDAEILQTRADAVALAVARRVGPAAAPAVVAALESPHNPDDLRAEALRWLSAHTDAIALARQHLTRPIIATVALEILTQANERVPLETLEQLVDADPRVAVTALRAARLHGVAAEPFLIEALQSELDDVARAAADSLGLVGTPAAVMALRERRTGLFTDGKLKSAASAAIESIQDRVGAAGGGLSVVDPDAAGRLSEAD